VQATLGLLSLGGREVKFSRSKSHRNNATDISEAARLWLASF